MSGIEAADMRPHTLDQGQITTDSESVEDLPSLPSHTWPSKSPLPTIVDQHSVLQEHSIMPTESAALPYDLNRARFVGPETEEKLEDWRQYAYHPPLPS